jgi:hypothetical protein
MWIMTKRTQNLNAIAFVYEHKRTRKSAVVYLDDVSQYDKRKDWVHTATIDPAAWIEHYLNNPQERQQQLESICFKGSKCD